MGVAALLDRRTTRVTQLMGATALACVLACAFSPAPSFAQTIADLSPSIPEGSEMLHTLREQIQIAQGRAPQVAA